MRQATRNRVMDDGIRSAYKALECFAEVGVTRWDAVTVLKAMCGDVDNPQIIAAARDAVRVVKTVRAQEAARAQRAKDKQAEAAKSYI